MRFSALALTGILFAGAKAVAVTAACNENNLLRAFEHAPTAAASYCATLTSPAAKPTFIGATTYADSQYTSACNCFTQTYIPGQPTAVACHGDNLLNAFEHSAIAAAAYCATVQASPTNAPTFLPASPTYAPTQLASACSCFEAAATSICGEQGEITPEDLFDVFLEELNGTAAECQAFCEKNPNCKSFGTDSLGECVLLNTNVYSYVTPYSDTGVYFYDKKCAAIPSR
jgi:hypothetical protein